MAPNPRVVQAFRSMKEIGISEEKVKPVLKKLLKLYDKNWELIESENYRVLADAIFEEEDSKVHFPFLSILLKFQVSSLDVFDIVLAFQLSDPKKGKTCDEEGIDEEGSMTDELVRPLKRTRLETQEGPASSSHPIGSSGAAETFLKEPKVEDELLPGSLQQKLLKSNVGNMRTEIMPASPGPVSIQHPSPVPVLSDHSGRDKGKQTVEPTPNYKGKEPMSSHVPFKGTGPERVSVALRIKDPAPEPSIITNKCVPATHALIIPKEEPFTDDIQQDEVPIAVIHPAPLLVDSSSRRDLPVEDFSTEESNWQDPPESIHAAEIAGTGASASVSERHTSCELATVPDEIPSALEIASSPLGEVQISVSYNSALGRPNFQLPSVELRTAGAEMPLIL
ncbi:hypothetical protein V6N12_053919 [Hibiscus sabdariffa]|uniref:WIYLD domain-containing protein n=1 Tax=Hibiscus sabdariffa TaxID=183260 RepID=A0ABR2D9T2_9ROSI